MHHTKSLDTCRTLDWHSGVMVLNIVENFDEPGKADAAPQIDPVGDLTSDGEALFSVDSMLLRELGERLVGRPHIALAELVKNSYDADATEVLIRFTPGQIEVIDNGHGMNLAEFQRFWMRVGSPHKEEQRISRDFGRPMTGSKGVGRLAVQFLARKLSMRTIAKHELENELEVTVNWNQAVRAGDLTQAKANYRVQESRSRFAGSSQHGTALILTDINQEWDAKDFAELAGEIWWLQPPFKSSSRTKSDRKNIFVIRLESPHDPEVVAEFENQLTAVLDIWTARLQGRITRRDEREPSVELLLDFADNNERVSHIYPARACTPNFIEFEIRIYNLKGRQPRGLLVDDARKYFDRFGGVHAYDAGFHLPYYGPDQDWLRIERDHSARQWQSRLLPNELQIQGGLRDLPTNRRIFGVVHVDTSHELSLSNDPNRRDDNCPVLQIQVTRDRLLENKAYEALVYVVRYAMDFYAMQQARRKFEEAEQAYVVESPRQKFENVDRVLQDIRETLPPPVYEELRVNVREAIEASEIETNAYRQRTGLLGALATAGMSALAIEHEVQKQYTILETVIYDLRKIRIRDESAIIQLTSVADQIDEWIRRVRATRSLFSHLLDEESREAQARFKAKPLLRDLVDQVGILLRGVQVNIDGIDMSLQMPYGGFSEWSAIFQNVLVNAVNAMLDSRYRRIDISSREREKTWEILVQDTGVGVDLHSANELFEPFKRKLKISDERRALGVGGSGLGLTIVRMIAESLGCEVKFVEPTEKFNTAFSLLWRKS